MTYLTIRQRARFVHEQIVTTRRCQVDKLSFILTTRASCPGGTILILTWYCHGLLCLRDLDIWIVWTHVNSPLV